MNGVAEPVGTLATALKHAEQLLNSDPSLAAEQAHEILKAVPQQPNAMLMLGAAQRLSGNVDAAILTLQELVRLYPQAALAQLELGLAYGAVRQGDAAVSHLRHAVALKPELSTAWLALGDHLRGIGDAEEADAAYAQHVRHSVHDARLLQAAGELVENRLPQAEQLLREHLRAHPTDVAAIRMFAELAARIGRYGDAENLLARCLELAPSFTAARHNYAIVLHRQYKSAQALTEIERLLEIDARNPGYRNLKAAILTHIGRYAEAIELYKGVLDSYPKQAKVWMSYGHALKTSGQQAACIAAYRKSIELMPGLGEAWWSLANLKTQQFASEDIATMQAQLASRDLADEDRFHFEFALGKALEDVGDYADSFKHYETGNRLRRKSIVYDGNETARHVERCKATFTSEYFQTRLSAGCQARDPIFIVGLPRSGSTLLEQILSSHPLVEGTMELPDITSIARDVGLVRVVELSPEELAALGERYLSQTRIQRKTAAPHFIDKMPNNFLHIGLIHSILPNAKIVDARRHPLGCCFSAFKQHFARGQHFSYGLEDVGRYYADYVRLMAHFDAVLPGKIHRVIYEAMVEDMEAQTRALLEYCGLPFDERCLRFYENERAVRTASSEQVRRPIYREGVDQWRHFEPWLSPLKDALGGCLTSYPTAPAGAT